MIWMTKLNFKIPFAIYVNKIYKFFLDFVKELFQSLPISKLIDLTRAKGLDLCLNFA